MSTNVDTFFEKATTWQPTGYVDNANDCNDGINSLNTVTTYSYDDVCYLTLYDALDESGGTGIVKIEADATPPEINTVPLGVTVQVLDGACWTNSVILSNNGIIELLGTGKFVNETIGTYKGNGSLDGSMMNSGLILPGN